MATDPKLGTKSQFYYGRHLDHRKRPSQFTVLPAPSQTDSNTVKDLVLDFTQINSGVRYAIGDTGYIYKVTTAGAWSVLDTLGENSGGGIEYRSDVDHIYISGTNKVSRIKRMTTLGTPEPDWFKNGISGSATCFKTGGANTYTTLAAVSENTQDKRSFTSDIEPLYQLGVKVVSKGSGDWTLTLHDDANNSLGTVTITNANLTNGRVNYFVFSTPIRIQRGDAGGGSALTYHFHITSTVADGTVQTTTASTLADCDMELWANALVSTQNGLHPMMSFINQTLIGNGRYLASYEPLQDSPTTADFNRHRITLPPGYEVCGVAQKNLLAIIAAEKRSTSGEFQEGALFFWDGVSQTYNDWYPVPEGSPESLFNHKNIARYIAGGALYRIDGTDQVAKEWTFRTTDSEFSGVSDVTHAPAHGMTVRRGILLMGYPYSTTNQSLEHGVYSLGAISEQYPSSFGYSYTTSNGNILNNGSNNLRIGCVKNYGDTLYISWRDDSKTGQKYGVDIVNNSSAPASDAQIQTLYFDDNRAYSYKRAGNIIVAYDTLPADCSIKIKYKIDGDTDWNYSESITAGTMYSFSVERLFQSITFGLDLVVGTTSPATQSLHLFFDPMLGTKPGP
jgi:hypothetical protein